MGFFFMWEINNLDCMFADIWVELHFPLLRPVRDSFQVIHELGLGSFNITNFDKKLRVIRKETHVMHDMPSVRSLMYTRKVKGRGQIPEALLLQ